MKKKSIYCIALLLLFTGCSKEEPKVEVVEEVKDIVIESESVKEEEPVETEEVVTEVIEEPHDIIEAKTYTPEEARSIISERALSVLQAIKSKDMNSLSTFVHPEKGARFSQFTSIYDSDLVLSYEEFIDIFDDDKVYSWGMNIFTMEPINETKSRMFTWIVEQDYTKAEAITYNAPTNKHGYPETYSKDYPKGIIVECYYEGENKDMDWKTRIIVFEEFQEQWYIVGFNNAFWTP